ncbi:MAG TPA: phage/plasmid replication protein [Bacteroidia bacterium]|jgi:hypothetical protein|nr:phage/plasmid replication protein [Bacteroidia bacterium]
MIDTIKLWLSAEDLIDTDIMAELPLKLSNTSTLVNDETNKVKVTGDLGSLSVLLSESGVSIKGSLSKYYKGNNMHTLTFKEIEDAFVKIGSALGIPIEKAKVRRLDITENYVVDYPVSNYFPYMGGMTYYDRLQMNNGIYYNGNKRTVLFYDKVHERKLKKEPVLDCYLNKNVFRYELRFMNRLGGQFSKPALLVSDLLDKAFFRGLLIIYINQYQGIYKHKSVLHYSKLKISNRAEFWQQIKLLGVESVGGEAMLLQTIRQGNKDKAFKNKMVAHRIMNDIRNIYQASTLSTSNSLIDELDIKIETKIKEYVKLNLSSQPEELCAAP